MTAPPMLSAAPIDQQTESDESRHPPQSRPRQARRYPELDLLRLAAALAVVGYHYFFRAEAPGRELAQTNLDDPFGIFQYGYLGVDAFFILSGFVILRSAMNKPPSAFVAARVGRLYPAFWVACTVTAAVVVLDPHSRLSIGIGDWVLNLTMAPGLLGANAVDGVYWTLLVELKFYLLIFVLGLVGMSIEHAYAMAIGWLSLAIVHSVTPLPSPLPDLLAPDWSAHFVVGMMFALIAVDRLRKRYVIVMTVAFGWAVQRAIVFAGDVQSDYGATPSPWVIAGVLTAIIAIIGFVVARGVRGRLARWLSRIAVLSGLTYPIYLVHGEIGYALFSWANGKAPPAVVLCGVLVVVAALAWTLHRVVEERFAAPVTAGIQRTWATLLGLYPGVPNLVTTVDSPGATDESHLAQSHERSHSSTR